MRVYLLKAYPREHHQQLEVKIHNIKKRIITLKTILQHRINQVYKTLKERVQSDHPNQDHYMQEIN